MKPLALVTIALSVAGLTFAAALAVGQESGPLREGLPGASTLAVAGPDSIDPIYDFPPNCLPIIGLPNSGINKLLANVSGEDVRIAVLAELSGQYAAYGRAWRDGIQLAVDAANAKGGIIGRPVVLEVTDVGAASPGPAAAAEALIKNPPFAVFGPVEEGAAQAALAIVRRVQTPMVLGTAGIDLQSFPESWVTRGQPNAQSRLMQLVDHARDEYKARSAALLWADTDYGRSTRDRLLGAFKRHSLQVVADAKIVVGQEDFANILARLRADPPDVLFLMAHGKDSARLLAALRRQGYNKPILIDGDVVDAGFLAAAGENANGLRGIAALHAAAPVARVRTMAARFAERFGYRPPAPGVNGFAAFGMLKGAVEKACSFNTRDLFKTWRNLMLDTRADPGILMDLKIDWSGNMLRDEFVFEIRNGAPQIIKLQRALSAYN